MGRFDFSVDSEPQDIPGMEGAVEGVIRAGRGTPFPDVARFGLVAAYVNSGRLEVAEAWLRSHETHFDHPIRRAYAWLFLLTPIDNSDTINEHSDRVLEFARNAVEAAPNSSSSIVALVLMSRAHEAKGNGSERMACIAKAVSVPDNSCGEFEDEISLRARSTAGRLHARMCQERGDWVQGLAAWKAWERYSTCGNDAWDQALQLSVGVGLCLEKLGRHREAADHYWKSVKNDYYSSEPASRLLEIHRSLGTLPQLTAEVKLEIERFGTSEKKPGDGLNLLANELGVSK
jgi:tetratricopeptide (TPR) repeat protein